MSFIHSLGSARNKWQMYLICFIIFAIFSFVFAIRFTLSYQRVFYPDAHSPTTDGTTTDILPRSSESFICDDISQNRFPTSSTTPSNDSFDAYRRQNLTQYCNIVPIPRSNWSKTHQYTEQDIAFVIFTGSKFYHTRATAIRDTWLSRITNYYFLSSTPYPHLPITVVPGAGEDLDSNTKKNLLWFTNNLSTTNESFD